MLVSDHFIIITASVIFDVSTSIIRSNYTVKHYRDVDIESDGFQQDMERMKHKLSGIDNNVDDMWTLFSSILLRAVDKHVLKKTKYNPLHSEPMWFNK